jgi:Uncharacterized conserved protein (DUF2203)
MKRRNKQLENMRALRLWTYDEAARVVPYLRSVVGSLREHWLEAQTQRRGGELLAARPGRPDRTRLLADVALHADQERAETHFNEAIEELQHLDVFLLDPVRGVALIPFRKEDDLAWYVYDQFDEHGLSGWRLHDDPLEKCRPLEMKESLN